MNLWGVGGKRKSDGGFFDRVPRKHPTQSKLAILYGGYPKTLTNIFGNKVYYYYFYKKIFFMINLKGRKHSKLTVLEELEPRYSKGGTKLKMVLAKCECGVEKEFTYEYLQKNDIKSCGCLSRKEIPLKRGDKFGHWTVIRRGADYKYKTTTALRYYCRCVCCKIKLVSKASLVSGKSTSCGCKGVAKPTIVINPLPKDTEDEKWVEHYVSPNHLVSNKGRIFSIPLNDYLLNMQINYKGVTYKALDSVYKSFNIGEDTSTSRIICLDGDVTNYELANLFLSEINTNNRDWVTNLLSNTRSSKLNRHGSRRKRFDVHTITRIDIVNLYKSQKGKSYFLGLELDLTFSNDLLAVSVDRLDNSKGYVKGNIVLATRFENMGRRHNTLEDMLELSTLIKNATN